MYLSRIQLNPRRRDAWRLLGNPQRMHAAVLASFPAPPTGDLAGDPRVLWRLDQDRECYFLYVVSPDQPDFAHLAEQAGWPTTERGVSKPYGEFLDRLAAGQQWAFRLAANPTRYVPAKEGGRAKRLAHVTVLQQETWLLEKAASAGFGVTTTARESIDGAVQIPEVAVTQRATRSFHRNGARDPVTLGTAQFDGRLEVVDAEALRRALVVGVGSAKAYGCGLMTLAGV
jgi:CRISPR system Cascade subunit CasE